MNKDEKTLEVGDYCLKGYEEVCVIERKGSIKELQENLLGRDHTRFSNAFSKLLECRNPVLLLDFPLVESYRKSRYVLSPEKVLDQLLHLVAVTSVNTIWSGACQLPKPRRKLGETMVRLMLHHALESEVTTTGPINEEVLNDLRRRFNDGKDL